MNSEAIIAKLKAVPGNVGFYYKDFTSGETLGYNENEQFEAASVIKLPVYMVIMKLAHEGKLSLSEKLTCHHADKMPPCGALYFFTDEPVVDIETLCGLMITISDNTATNMLISRLGIDFLNEEFKKIGLEKTHIERLLFDSEASAQGKCNYIVPAEMGMLLEQVYRRTFVSKEVSEAIEKLLLEQQINHKIPGYLRDEVAVAHKTGEDDNLTNDVGIVYAKKPFVVSFASYNTDVPTAEIAIREISRDLAGIVPYKA